MIFHRLKKIKNGKEVEYKIELIERQYFLDKKLGEVLSGIKDEAEGQTLVTVLDSGFKSGIKIAEMKLGQEIKL